MVLQPFVKDTSLVVLILTFGGWLAGSFLPFFVKDGFVDGFLAHKRLVVFTFFRSLK